MTPHPSTQPFEASLDLPSAVRRAARTLTLLYWGCLWLGYSIVGAFTHTDPWQSVPLKAVLFCACALMTRAMAVPLLRARKLPLPQQLLIGFALTALAAPLYVAIDHLNYALCQYPDPVAFDPVYAAATLLQGASMVFGWTCLFMALRYHFEVRDREHRLAAAREEALTMQMRALRYQVNPHFLFNTLNSVAGLIEEGDAGRAQGMVLSLSTFLRTTLSLDPMHDVPLADEFALQEEYLAIERQRYSDRMSFRIDMPDEVRGALVPSLILQPLIENAIKHGVGATVGKVAIEVTAQRQSDRLCVVVENDMPLDGAPSRTPAGMCMGLRNVMQRLSLRFQGDSAFTSGSVAPGRYRVAIELPWRLA